MFGLTKKKRAYKQGQISVTDPAVRDRLNFLGLTEADLGVIATWEEVCRKSLDHLVDRFYEHVQGNNITRGILLKHSTIERQRPMLTRYILTMFSGRVDDEYIKYRRHVGSVHDDIDLDSNWYVAMYEIIRRVLTEAVETAGANRAEADDFGDSLGRLIQSDIGLVVTALTDSRREKLMRAGDAKKLHEEVGKFLNEAVTILEQVAARDLTVHMDGSFEGEYAKIQTLLNESIDNLHDAMSQVSSGADQVASAANQISAGSQALAQGASEQASTLQEVTQNFKEMANMAAQNAGNAKAARQLSEAARGSANKGVESMRQLSQAVDRIKSSADSTAKIVKTIDDIAFQTNLLALNAAVEAARAGDAGKGFAVVAEEVRNLAMRSAEAAKQTANLIEESVKNAEGGVSLNQQVIRNLEEINEQVNKVGEVMGEISAASDQQSQRIEQINHAVDQMNQVTQQTAANAEESAAASQELHGQSQEMTSMVNSFKLTTGARSGLRHPAQPNLGGANGRANGTHRSAGVDFEVARTKHLLWKMRLRDFLDGKASLSEKEAVSHKDCDLGKWLYSRGMSEYGDLQEMQQLEAMHRDLHALIKKIVSTKHAGDKAEAEREFLKVEPISARIVGLLTAIERSASGGSAHQPAAYQAWDQPHYTVNPGASGDDLWQDF